MTRYIAIFVLLLAVGAAAQRATAEELRTMIQQGHIAPVHAFAFSPDGALLASGGGSWDNAAGGGVPDRLLKLWRVADGWLARSLEGHTDSVKSIAFSWDGTLASAGGRDGSVKLWDPRDGRLRATLFALDDATVVLTPEGFFSGTGDVAKYVHFVRGLQTYDQKQFYDVFYRPDLVEKKLKGEDISRFRKAIGLPPVGETTPSGSQSSTAPIR